MTIYTRSFLISSSAAAILLLSPGCRGDVDEFENDGFASTWEAERWERLVFCEMIRTGLTTPKAFDEHYSSDDLTPEIVELATDVVYLVDEEARPYREFCDALPYDWQADSVSCQIANSIAFKGSAAGAIVLLAAGWASTFCEASPASCFLADAFGEEEYAKLAEEGVLLESEELTGCRH